MINLSELTDLLSLEKIKDNNFIGQNYKTEWGRVFGGQVLAQSINAAYKTIDNIKQIVKHARTY